jgi:hypothetical protein
MLGTRGLQSPWLNLGDLPPREGLSADGCAILCVGTLPAPARDPAEPIERAG